MAFTTSVASASVKLVDIFMEFGITLEKSVSDKITWKFVHSKVSLTAYIDSNLRFEKIARNFTNPI